MEDYTVCNPREFNAETLRRIQANWHMAPIVLGYDTQADPLDLRGAEIHGSGTEWILVS